ncbi:MAG: hypothetical protein L6Q97_16815, partial [Thermoanaerobaculia bacterium]|nr:hypothetical protein [Thermoanaerobaculia bacterium]
IVYTDFSLRSKFTGIRLAHLIQGPRVFGKISSAARNLGNILNINNLSYRGQQAAFGSDLYPITRVSLAAQRDILIRRRGFVGNH